VGEEEGRKKASGSVGKTDGAEREFEAANVIEPKTNRRICGMR